MFWLVRLVVVVAAIKALLWGWDQYQHAGGSAEDEVLDSDKVCRIVSADTQQCLCRHRLTNELLDLTYEECLSLAR